LRQLGGIGDRLRAVIHVAQTARRKPHSGLVAGLKDAERANPDRPEEYHPPAARRVNNNEDHGEESRGAECNNPES